MAEIVEIHVQITAQSNEARKDAIKMLRKLLAELNKTPRMGLFQERNEVSEGSLVIESQ